MASTQVNRRSFLQTIGLLAGLQVDGGFDRSLPLMRDPIYEELGVIPFINAAGAYTDLGGALIPDEVTAAMKEVSQHSVSISELQQALGKKIAAMLGCEAALVTAGCASSLTLATAACTAGMDPDKIRRLPDTTGMKNEVILQKTHRFEYDHALRNAGVRLIEVESSEQLISAVNNRTAMLFFLNSADHRGKIRRAEFAQLAARVHVPALVDAAADLPPIENLWTLTRMGYDLVAFSGGKSLRGPQCSGLLIGKKHLVEAAFLNGPPHSDSLGRITKVGKEEIVGLYKALGLFLDTDHTAEWNEWENRVARITRVLSQIHGVTASLVVPAIPHHRPQVHLEWNVNDIHVSSGHLVAMLRSGKPRIELSPVLEDSSAGLDVAVWMLRPGEDIIVASRISEVLRQGIKGNT